MTTPASPVSAMLLFSRTLRLEPSSTMPASESSSGFRTTPLMVLFRMVWPCELSTWIDMPLPMNVLPSMRLFSDSLSIRMPVSMLWSTWLLRTVLPVRPLSASNR